jgi:hypothetical protein
MRRHVKRTAGLVLICCVLAVAVLADGAHASETNLAPIESACLTDPANARNWRILFRFDIPDALAGATVDLATLRVLLPTDAHQEQGYSIEVFPITRTWSAEAAVWDDGWESGDGAWSERHGSISSVAGGRRGAVAVDVTSVVNQWLRGGNRSAGLVLVPIAPGSAAALTAPPGEAALRVWFTRARRKSDHAEH